MRCSTFTHSPIPVRPRLPGRTWCGSWRRPAISHGSRRYQGGLKPRLHSPRFFPFNQAIRGLPDRRPQKQGTSRPMLQPAEAAATADALVKDTTTQTFVKDVIEESKRQPVLVDFWAPWCGPCKQLTPVLEKAVKAAKGKVKLVKMDIDKHPAIPGQMGIQSIPAVIAFANGQPADGFMRALPPSQVVPRTSAATKGSDGNRTP